MQLGSAAAYPISNNQVQEAKAKGISPCAPGYVLQEFPGYTGQWGDAASRMSSWQCIKVADVSAAPTASQFVQAPAPIITVSPTISTQVSPQISPVFQQQFQPSGSPITAGTAQSAPANQASPTGVTAADVQKMMESQAAQYEAQRRAEAEARAADNAAMMRAMEMQREQLATAMSSQSTQAAPLPSMPPPQVDNASPLPAIPDFVLPSGAALPAAQNAPALTTIQTSGMNPAIIAIAVIGALALMGTKGKKNVSR